MFKKENTVYINLSLYIYVCVCVSVCVCVICVCVLFAVFDLCFDETMIFHK